MQRREIETREVRHAKTREIIFALRRINDCADLSVELTNASLWSRFGQMMRWVASASRRHLYILFVGKLTYERRRPRRHGFRSQSFLSEACTAAHVWQSVNWSLLHKVAGLINCFFKNLFICIGFKN